jgi:hypothetical protein
MGIAQVLDADLERRHDHKEVWLFGSDDVSRDKRFSHAARDVKRVDSVLFMEGMDGVLLVVT